MTAATHPWTFVHPACGRPVAHAARIPRHADDIGTADDWQHPDGSPVRNGDRFTCPTCRVGLLDRLTFAAMTVEANWRRRDAA